MQADSRQFFEEVKQDAVKYAELKIELLKLGTYERTGKVISVLSYGIILTALTLFFLMMTFIALGFFLSDVFDSLAAGFAVVAGLWLLLIAGVILFRKKIRNYVLNFVIATLVANDKKRETKDETNTSGDSIG
ncbi:MAG: phage holin family protein [Tannerella sp.]|jgi:hypothetical protein|nr:phage holin family protein [Tannerella sp.]